MMVFFMDFITPPVGLGCWLLVFFLYGCLCTPTWLLQCWESLRVFGRRLRYLTSHTFNALAIGWLVFLLVLLVIGALVNCYCNASMPGRALGYGGI